MKHTEPGGEAIRLTNRTAKGLREQAKRQQFALRLTAVILTLALAGLSVYLGMRHLLWVPALLLAAIALDAVLLMLARGRYIQLTGQAICTEAAARIMRGERAEQQRIIQAQRDLADIKADLYAAPAGGRDQREPDEEDDDLFGGTPSVTAGVSAATRRMPAVSPRASAASPAPEQGGEGAQPPRRRRRQARLQVISGEEAR